MIKNTRSLISFKALLLILVILAGLLLSDIFRQTGAETSHETNTAQAVFSQTKEHAKITRALVKELKRSHYLDEALDDVFSEKVFDNFIKLLDPARVHFLEADIEDFSKYRHSLDDDLKQGDLEHAFFIYGRYHQRRKQRLDYSLEILNKGIDFLDFKKHEHLELDRENLPWLDNMDTAKDLWRRLLKNEILNLKLDEKTEKNDSSSEKVDITPVEKEILEKESEDIPPDKGDTDQKTDDLPVENILSPLIKRYQNQLRLLDETNSDDVFEYFITAYTHSYDPHTEYFPPAKADNFDIHMRLSLEGIGALLQREDQYTKVVSLVAGGPAEQGNELQPADLIVAVGQGENGELQDVVGWRLDEVVNLIRGPKGTVVRLKVMPADSADMGKTRVISIKRDTVKLEEESAKKAVIHVKRGETLYKVGVITLPAFYLDFEAAMSRDPNYRSSTRDVEKLILELKDENIDSLIFDLRNNGGGSLQEANDITGLFIRTGPVVQIRNAKNKIFLFNDDDPKLFYNGPMAVLVNRLSASASEIVAGAIQDYGCGIVIGSQTFGKGTVQTMESFEPGRLKYTEAKYYRVNGDSTQNRGVIPDIVLPTVLDQDEIGESSLPQHMAWDQITPADYDRVAVLKPTIDYLLKIHQQRIKENADFIYLNERVQFLEENRKKTSVSLNESERIQERYATEQRLLGIENRRRKALGKEPYKDYAELESTEKKDKDPEDDSILHETGEILTDWLIEKVAQQNEKN